MSFFFSFLLSMYLFLIGLFHLNDFSFIPVIALPLRYNSIFKKYPEAETQADWKERRKCIVTSRVTNDPSGAVHLQVS